MSPAKVNFVLCRLSGVAVKDKQMPEVTSWVHVRSKTPILTVYTRVRQSHLTHICISQTYTRFQRTLFVRTKHNLQIIGVNP